MSRIIDISQKLHPDMVVYPGDPRFNSVCISSFQRGDMCEVSELTIGTHCGTHVDAPLHMIPHGAPLEGLELDCFIGPCRVLTFNSAVINEKMLAEKNIQPGDRILLRTDAKGKYLKNGRFNPAVLSVRAAQYLVEQKIKLIGIDAPTVENMELCDGEIHRALLGAGIPILEGLLLEAADKEEYDLCALPINCIGENGAPCRAVLIEK